MAFTKKLRSYFFGTFPNNSRGKQTGFKTDDQPNQERFEEQMASSPFFMEEDDRAKQESAIPENIEDIVGLVAITTDTKAKANTSGLEGDRTLVTHAGQLPTSAADAAQSIAGSGAFNDSPIEVTVDAGVLTRNSYLFKLKETFRSWLETLRLNVDTNITNIAQNASDILSNTNLINNATNTYDTEGVWHNH
jgi:hypothetical protein